MSPDGRRPRTALASPGSVLFVALTIGSLGCGGGPFELTRSTMEDHRARWLAAGLRDYRYEHSRQCECLGSMTSLALVEVRGGLVAEVRYTESGETVHPADRELFPTIDDLFALIDEAIRRDAASLMVSYDGTLGYPTNIDIDYDVEVVDDEVTIEAANLAAF